MERAVSLTVDERWDLVDRIAKRTVEVGAYKPTLRDALADITVRPATGIPIAIAVIFSLWAFFCNFAGALFTDGFFIRLFDVQWLPWIQAHFPAAPGSTAYYIFVGDPAATNCFEAFGVLTSGLFVAFGVVLPAIIAFYLVLTILEDIGYIPRLAVLVDTVLHKIGLHGYAIVPAILSLGCNIPGVAATRPLETRKQRFLMMTLLAVFIPCGAQIGVMLALIPNLIVFVFIALLIGLFTFGFLLSKVWPGESPEILIDVPPFRMPTWGNIWRKLWTRVGHFLKVAVPFVLLGCVIVMILYVTGAMDHIASALSPVFTGMFGLPEDVVAPLVAGFLRKDLAVGMLGGISMTTWQMVSSVILLCVYFPCLATFALMMKEMRGKEIAATLGFLIAMIFVYGGILHLIGMAAGVA